MGNLHKPRRYSRPLRHVFYLSAQTSMMRDGPNRDYYLKKRDHGRTHTQAVIALARRRIDVLWALLRDERTYTAIPPAARSGGLTTPLRFPVPDPRARLDNRWAAVDQHRRSDISRNAFGDAAASLAQWAASAQLRRQRPAQATFPAEIQRLIDRLVADMPFRPVGMLGTQPGADLLRTPGVFQLVLHQIPQFGVKDQGARSLASGVVASTGMCEIGVIEALVVRLEVTP